MMRERAKFSPRDRNCLYLYLTFNLYIIQSSFIMPPLLFPLPSTNLLSLGGSTFIDPSGSHTTQLADATQARTKFQIALKAFTDKIPGASAVQVIDVNFSLPLLNIPS